MLDEAFDAQLRASYEAVKQLIAETTEWPSDCRVAGAMAAVAHTAFHLGQIRQSLYGLR